MDTAIDTLCKRAAPEINWLLTEPPFMTPAGWDFGWFCREHALCTVILGSLLGLPMTVVRGDFLLQYGPHRLCSIGSGDDHAWCSTEGAVVLDISMFLDYLPQKPPTIRLACPVRAIGRNGDFHIRFLPDTTTATDTIEDEFLIGYIPRSSHSYTLPDLLASPDVLLPSSEAIDISCRVALHAFRVMTGTTPSVVGRLSQPAALARLTRESPSPREEVMSFRKG